MDLGYKIIAVDFDGTLCENKWPEIGEPNTKLIEYLRERKEAGNKVILWTCRNGELLFDAIVWCLGQGLSFDAINENLPEVIEKMGGDSRKIFAHEYIDDRMINQYLDIPSAYPDIFSKKSEPEWKRIDSFMNGMTILGSRHNLKRMSEKLHTLEQVSGQNIDTLISLFAEGCTLITPEAKKVIDSIDKKALGEFIHEHYDEFVKTEEVKHTEATEPIIFGQVDYYRESVKSVVDKINAVGNPNLVFPDEFKQDKY